MTGRALIKNIYSVVPFKKQLFRVFRKLWAPPHRIYKHLHFKGVFKVKVDQDTSFRIRHYGNEIENDIFWKGLTEGWEKTSMQYWISLSRMSSVILDIGANTGIYALAAKAVNPGSRVIAFEPLKQMHAKLKNNTALNHFDIDCLQMAASDTTGTALIFESGDDHQAGASMNVEAKQTGILNIETEINTITLDDFVKNSGIPGIDLIKIDVETHEPNVLSGYKEFLPLHQPDFLIEILTDEVGEKVQQAFRGLNYFYFNINDRDGTIRRTEKITKSEHFNFLILKKDSAARLNLI